jgi:hypothetical protein
MTTREQRAQTYRVKRGAGWTCSTEGCNQDIGILVVEGADGLTTSCRAHLGRRKPTPGQWLEREQAEKEAKGR